MLSHDEAMQAGIAYAWGREDASGLRTVSPTEAPGSLVFAETYAGAWDEFRAGSRHYMTNVGSAYECWQASGGATIFPPAFAAFDSGARETPPVSA